MEELEFGKVASYAEKIEDYSIEIKKQKQAVETISRKLKMMGSYYEIERTLSVIAADMNAEQIQMKQCGDRLNDIVKAYKDTETMIVTAAKPISRV